MKATQNFKMSATTKYLLSTITDKTARVIFRQNMVQSQLASEIKPVSAKEEKKR